MKKSDKIKGWYLAVSFALFAIAETSLFVAGIVAINFCVAAIIYTGVAKFLQLLKFKP